MGWVMPAMMAGSALMGGMGGKGKSKSQTTTSTQQNNMWNQGLGQGLWDDYMGALGQAGNIDWGPSGKQRRIFNSMFGEAMGGGGGGGQGGMQGDMQRRGGGGGPGWQEGFQNLINMGKGGGGGGGNPNARYAGQNVDYTDYEKSVLDPNYMDVASDPLIQKQQEYRRGLFDENAAASRSQAMSPFIQAGGTMGLTGAAMGMQGKMQQANERDWLGQENEMYLGERGQRRQERMGANQAWSGRESTYDSSGMSADAQRAAARAAANASMYGSRLSSYSQLQSAQMAAAASRYGADKSYAAQMASVGAQRAAADWSKKMAMFGMAGDMANMRRQGQGLGALNLYGNALSQNLPWQQAFGSSTSTNTVPGQGSAFGNFLTGAAGGAMQGYGMGREWGFGGPKQTQMGRK